MIRVLIADDSSTMRSILRRCLKSLGVADPVEASDGLQAIEQFKKGGFNLVLTDWNMPVKSGLELIREIRSLDPQVPIVMITTEAERSQVIEAVQAGASDYLIKPFTAAALEQKLDRFTAIA